MTYLHLVLVASVVLVLYLLLQYLQLRFISPSAYHSWRYDKYVPAEGEYNNMQVKYNFNGMIKAVRMDPKVVKRKIKTIKLEE